MHMFVMDNIGIMAASLSATCPRESVLPIWLQPDFSVVFEGYVAGAVNRPKCQQGRSRSLTTDILRTCQLGPYGSES